MKLLHALLCLTCLSTTTAQSQIYTVTEVYPSSSDAKIIYDSVYVTTPEGKVSKYSIPYIKNVAAHDASLSAILNLIANKGYVLDENPPFVRTDYSGGDPLNGRTIVRMFLRKKE